MLEETSPHACPRQHPGRLNLAMRIESRRGSRPAPVHNHQQELAEELHARRHLLATTPVSLMDALRDLGERPAESGFLPMAAADATAFPAFLADALGI